jgi:plastocyanin
MRRSVFVLVLFFAVVCLLSGAMAGTNVFQATIDSDGVQKVEIVAGEYFFNPDAIVVKVNVPVELKVRKEPGIVPHDFVIKAPEAGLDVLESLGVEPKTIRLTATKVGKYPFYCDKKLIFSKSHREKGMEGTLEVTE